MRQALTRHPDSPCTAATRIEVEVAQPRPGALMLTYLVTGKLMALRIPAETTPARSDALWEHTCFEAFVRASSGAAYYEFNFSPSTRWAAYRFSEYRDGMRVADDVRAPRITVHSTAETCTLRAALELDRLPNLPDDTAWQIGLSAVIEETTGHKSYWALTHPPGKPDFHHSDCFAHELPAAWRS